MSNQSQFRSGFVRSDGVRLHYLAWEGGGPALVFLAGFGNTPHFFDGVAKRMTDRFRGLGLTRRGHGESDQPETGYDVPTLARDIVGLLDALHIERASFVGHSFAGVELVQLALAHAERVEKLVFLDALYDWIKADGNLMASNPLLAETPPPPDFASAEDYSQDFVTRYAEYRRLRSPQWDTMIAHALERTPEGRFRERLRRETVNSLEMGYVRFAPDWRLIRRPTLAIYASQDETWALPEGASAELREANRVFIERVHRERNARCIERARREVPGIEILELHNASHYCFLDREDEVVEAMRRFL